MVGIIQPKTVTEKPFLTGILIKRRLSVLLKVSLNALKTQKNVELAYSDIEEEYER